jgi:hypothetical protein
VDPVEHRVDLGAFQFAFNSVSKELITSRRFHFVYSFVRITRNVNGHDIFGVDDFVYKGTGFLGEIVEARNINLIKNEEGWFVHKEGLDGVK